MNYELSYDRFHSKSKYIYRVVQDMEKDGLGEKSASVAFPMAPALKKYYGDFILEAVRIFNFQINSHAVSSAFHTDNEPDFLFVDASFFKVFDFPLEKGHKDSVLVNPMSVVLTQEMAEKYFGKEDPIGKKLIYGEGVFFTVTGILQPIQQPTHIPLGFLASFSSLEMMLNHYGIMRDSWVWNPCWTYVVLNKNASPEEFEYQLKVLVERVFPEVIGRYTTLHLQPLTEIHLYSNLDYELRKNGDIRYIYIFVGIGLLMLVVTAINFANLSTARYSLRAKEVGIRKAIGADRTELIEQFLVESIFISLISVFLSLIFVEMLLPLLSQVLGRKLYLQSIDFRVLLACIFVSSVIVGIAASLYPSYYLSRFQPIEALNGALSKGVKSKRFRGILVVLQFSITIFLIISTLVIFEQVYYMRQNDVGFESRDVLVIPLSEIQSRALYPNLADEIKKIHGVKHITAMEEVLGVRHQVHFYQYFHNEEEDIIFAPSMIVRYGFLETFGIQLLAGRDFSEVGNDEKDAVIINEAMVEYMGWKTPQEAIGKTLKSLKGKETVVGVMKNFNFETLHNWVSPLVIDLASHTFETIMASRYIALKINPEQKEHIISELTKLWDKKIPYKPFEYFELDKEIDSQYYEEMRLGVISFYFALVAIIISMLGLFGLSSFVIGQRKKEVAIRKALGIKDWQVALLLSKEFLWLVITAMLIAFPISYAIMQFWLQNFAFHTNIGLAPFIISGVICLIDTILTVSYHAIKASFRSPIQDLQ
ncbi:MAG: ABC transporter permease [Flammeovirgaceae bacterium]